MDRPERIVTYPRASSDPRDMDDWCGAFLQGLDTGLVPSPVERTSTPVANEVTQLLHLDFGDQLYLASIEQPAAELEMGDILGKRARAAVREHASGSIQAGITSGFPMASVVERSHMPMGMGPYRSSSVHSIESSLSNQVERGLEEEDDFGEIAGMLRRSPPYKKGPASLATGVPQLKFERRAFSEGAAGDDHSDHWVRASNGHHAQLYTSAAIPDDQDDQDMNDWEADDLSHTRAACQSQKTAPWTRTEDQVIAEAVKRFGCKWGVLAALLPGRTDNAVRNRWHRLERARKWREESAPDDAKGAFVYDEEPPLPPPPAASTLAPALPGMRLSGSGGYKCGRCGQPKRGHLCTVTLESDHLVYQAAQDKMRELHLQQHSAADKRNMPPVGNRRKQSAKEDADAPWDNGQMLAQPFMLQAHAIPVLQAHVMQPAQAQPAQAQPQPSTAAAAQPAPSAVLSLGSQALAAQRQQQQRLQAQAQRRHQIKMAQAQLAHQQAQQARWQEQQQQQQQHARALHASAHHAEARNVAQRADGSVLGSVVASRDPSPSVGRNASPFQFGDGSQERERFRHASGVVASGTCAAIQPTEHPAASSEQQLDPDLLHISTHELIHLRSLLGEDEPSLQIEVAADQFSANELADCDGRLTPHVQVDLACIERADPSHAPPGLDRSISAPAGMLLERDGDALGMSRWPQSPRAFGGKAMVLQLTPKGAKGDSGAGVPSPTATAA